MDVSAPNEAAIGLVDRVQILWKRGSEDTSRAAFESVLEELGIAVGNKAWTDGSDVIGTAFEMAIPKSERRLLGQYFTPIDIGRVMARWVLADSPSLLLDPGCGSGSLLIAASHESIAGTHMLGIDVDPLAVLMATENMRLRSLRNTTIRCSNFLLEDLEEQPDAVICNPPYTRNQLMSSDEKSLIHLGFSERLGTNFNRQASMHVLFLLRALEVSSAGARLAFLTPSNWMDTKSARLIKDYLLESSSVEAIVNISASELLFDHANTTASITLIKKGVRSKFQTRVLQSNSVEGRDIDQLLDNPDAGDNVQLSTDAKWSRGPVKSLTGQPLGELANVRRGLATGCNAFFVISESTRRKWNIGLSSLRPCISSPKKMHMLTLDEPAFQALSTDTPKWLFSPRKPRSSGPLADYLLEGQKTFAVESRYLVMQRVKAKRPWYDLETNFDAPIVMSYLNKSSVSFMRNLIGAVPLNNWIAILPRNGVDPDQLVEALRSPQFIVTLKEHAREYGNGLWKIEPSEIQNLRLPDSFSFDI